ncbi:MAG: hypothetical protein QXL83_07835 [Zestosphaera sp.]
MKCFERQYSYRGASVQIVVYTSTDIICDEVKEAILGGINEVLNFIRRHDGCHIRSKEHLEVTSGDNTVTVEIKPLNTLARMFWGTAVDKVREVCKG